MGTSRSNPIALPSRYVSKLPPGHSFAPSVPVIKTDSYRETIPCSVTSMRKLSINKLIAQEQDDPHLAFLWVLRQRSHDNIAQMHAQQKCAAIVKHL